MNNFISNILTPKTRDNVSRYYFSRLTEEQKVMYDAIFSGIKAYSKRIRMPQRPVNEISKMFNCVMLDNPLIFYVSSFNHLNDLYKKQCFIEPVYGYAKHLTKEYTVAVEKYLSVFDRVRDKSDIDKEIFVHDYCLDNFSYDYKFGDLSHSVLGPVFNKVAVCEGIAKFVKLAFDRVGVKSLVVSGKGKNPMLQGTAAEMHAWNIVKIGGKTYHLDVTFDMTLKDKVNRYDYFNLCDQDIKKDHIIIDAVPACTTIGGDYFSVNSLAVRNFAELENHIDKFLKRGNKTIPVKLLNAVYTDGIVDKVMETALRQYCKINSRGGTVDVRYNSSQMVFEICLK